MSESQSKGSLLLAWQVKDKHCLVIGAGDVALSRINHLVIAQAKITVITGQNGNIHPDIIKLNEQEIYSKIQAQINNENFEIVCCCIDDYTLSTAIYYQCKYLGINCNIADKPHLCDFYFGSMINEKNLQIMISTNGQSPRLSKLIKDSIQKQFINGVDLNIAVENLGAIRAKLRELKLVDKIDPNDNLPIIEKRMSWIKTLTDMYTIKQWSSKRLLQQEIETIVNYFPDFPPSI
ncbi:putative NAD(P)-binding-domain-containing protein [Scheffersomyces amazonensis]|uniref:putative NAD(P)-binding-domain-containing protein n=1 Tax=Scheffersomyces amazonensis TaxID=1078765 RepID=UPI00315E0180